MKTFNEWSGKEPKISAPEDLMREHGLLNRILLIYEEFISEGFQVDLLHDSADIVRKFIENYHEELEEEYIFTPLKKHGKHVDMISTLWKQHDDGKILTDIIRKSTNKAELTKACKNFLKMYRRHECYEDTIIFPSLYEIMSQKSVMELGEMFEEKEHKILGKDSFNSTLKKVESIEKELGIFDLSKVNLR